MFNYNQRQKDWLHFIYLLGKVEDDQFLLAEKLGIITGIIGALPQDQHFNV
ncbi:MAG TPA: hypothetical protein VEY06_13910 [Flavisolibacter sp.]|nr:hypothetical protein [Flavisolibacter sp.]